MDRLPADSVDSPTGTAATATLVEVYWRPGCPFCRALMGPLRESGVPVREVDIWEDPAAAARVRAMANGNETVPTVFVGDTAMVNPTLEQVLTAATGERPAPRVATDRTLLGRWLYRWRFQGSDLR